MATNPYADIMAQWQQAFDTQVNTPPNDEHFAASNSIKDLNDQLYGLGSYASQGPAQGGAEYWALPENQLPVVMGKQDTQNWTNSNYGMGPQGSVLQDNSANLQKYGAATGLPPGMEAYWSKPDWQNTPENISRVNSDYYKYSGTQPPQTQAQTPPAQLRQGQNAQFTGAPSVNSSFSPSGMSAQQPRQNFQRQAPQQSITQWYGNQGGQQGYGDNNSNNYPPWWMNTAYRGF